MLKTISILSLAAVLCVPIGASAGSPTYKNFTATGTTAAEVIIPPDPSLQSRVVSLFGTSDKSGSVFTLTSGKAAYTIVGTNAAGTTIVVNTNYGIAASDVLIICRADGSTNFARTVSSTNNATNIVLSASTQNQLLPGDSVYKQGSAVTIKCGAASQNYNGNAIFVGDFGRPIRCVLDGTSACSIDSLSVRQE